MKICYIVGAFPNMKCGIGDYTRIISKKMSSHNDIYVITSKMAKSSSNVFGIMDKWNFKELNTLINKIKSINPDIVHIQYPSSEYGKSLMINLLPVIIKRKMNTHIVITIHEYLSFTKKGRIRIAIGTRKVDGIIAVEEKFLKAFGKNLFFNKKATTKYIPIYSNIPKSNLSEKGKQKLKEKYNINSGTLLSFFGFIGPTKGFELLIDVMEKYKHENKNIKLLCIGELGDDKYHNYLRNLINNKGILNDIIFTGFIDSENEVADLLSISDVCVLPFRDGVSERNGSFLAAYNQQIKIVTTSKTEKKDSNYVYYSIPDNLNSLLEKIDYALSDQNQNIINRNSNSIEEIYKQHLNFYNEVLLK